MGRLPKGFKKTLQHHADGPEQSEPSPTAQPAGSASETKTTKDHGSANAFLKDTPTVTQGGKSKPEPSSNANDDNHEDDQEQPAPGTETKGQMIQRHKREMQAFKKNLPRLGKKSKDEVAKLTAEIEARHAKELEQLDQASSSTATEEKHAQATESVFTGIQQLNIDEAGEGDEHDAGGKHMTKAMKRRQKQAAAEAQREARIAAEAAAAGPSARAQEEEALISLLTPLGLKMREIRADGHCLYRSIEDQLKLNDSSTGTVMDYQQLRSAAAKHIRSHPEEYQHFIEPQDGESPDQALQRYCEELENTAVWGGQLELSVLSQVLRRPIKVLAVGLPPLTLGEEFSDTAQPLQVCYLRHAFGLGEHYNSLGVVDARQAEEGL